MADWATRLRNSEDENFNGDPWAVQPGDRSSVFLSSLVIVRSPSAFTCRGHDVDYTVCLPYYVQLELQGAVVRCYRVPAGAVTDFASVPPAFRWLIGRIGRWTEASVVHDAAYRRELEVRDSNNVWTPWQGDRQEADRILRTLMTKAGVRLWERCVINCAVWLFGKGAWETSSTTAPNPVAPPSAPPSPPPS